MGPIPIISVSASAASILVFFFLSYLFRKKTLSPMLKNFRMSLLCAGFIAICYSLPGTLVKNVYWVCLVYLFNQIFFLGIFFFLSRFLIPIIAPGPRPPFIARSLPWIIAIWTVVYVLIKLWQFSKVYEAAQIVPFGKHFIIYKCSAAVYPSIITGLVAATVSFIGAAIIFIRIFSLTDKKLIRRSFLIGSGLFSLVLWSLTGWVIATLPRFTFFGFISAVFGIIGLVLISSATFFVKIKEEEEQNYY